MMPLLVVRHFVFFYTYNVPITSTADSISLHPMSLLPNNTTNPNRMSTTYMNGHASYSKRSSSTL